MRCCCKDEYKAATGAVIAADFYHSNALMPLSDEAIVARVVRSLETCEPGFLGAQVRLIWPLHCRLNAWLAPHSSLHCPLNTPPLLMKVWLPMDACYW